MIVVPRDESCFYFDMTNYMTKKLHSTFMLFIYHSMHTVLLKSMECAIISIRTILSYFLLQ